MDLPIIGRMRERSPPCQCRDMPRTFWCFMKSKRGYYVLWQAEAAYSMSQLGWVEIKHSKKNKKKKTEGLLLYTGGMHSCIFGFDLLKAKTTESNLGFLSFSRNLHRRKGSRGSRVSCGSSQSLSLGNWDINTCITVLDKKKTTNTTYFFSRESALLYVEYAVRSEMVVWGSREWLCLSRLVIFKRIASHSYSTLSHTHTLMLETSLLCSFSLRAPTLAPS